MFFLHENHSLLNIENEWKQDLINRQLFCSHGSIPSKYESRVITEIFDNEGRFLLLHIMLNEMELVLVNIYSPIKDKRKFFTVC